MGNAQIEESVTLVVRKQKLLGVVGRDADAVDALVDHAVEHTRWLTSEIAVLAERGGGDHAAKRLACS
jgi:hypothetical protein